MTPGDERRTTHSSARLLFLSYFVLKVYIIIEYPGTYIENTSHRTAKILRWGSSSFTWSRREVRAHGRDKLLPLPISHNFWSRSLFDSLYVTPMCAMAAPSRQYISSRQSLVGTVIRCVVLTDKILVVQGVFVYNGCGSAVPERSRLINTPPPHLCMCSFSSCFASLLFFSRHSLDALY